MPFGSNDWLALNPEPTLEPDLPIIDPHHHFWDFRLDRFALPALPPPRARRRCKLGAQYRRNSLCRGTGHV